MAFKEEAWYSELRRRVGGSLQRMVMRIRRIAEMGFSPAICCSVFGWLGSWFGYDEFVGCLHCLLVIFFLD